MKRKNIKTLLGCVLVFQVVGLLAAYLFFSSSGYYDIQYNEYHSFNFASANPKASHAIEQVKERFTILQASSVLDDARLPDEIEASTYIAYRIVLSENTKHTLTFKIYGVNRLEQIVSVDTLTFNMNEDDPAMSHTVWTAENKLTNGGIMYARGL